MSASQRRKGAAFTEFVLHIPGKPPLKNSKHRIFANRNGGKGVGRQLSNEYAEFVGRVELAWHEAGRPTIKSDLWSATISAYWPRKTSKKNPIGEGVAMADVDAPIECLFDALEHVGMIDNDARIVQVTASKEYDKENPRIVVALMEVMGR